MNRINEKYKYETTPIAKKSSIIQGEKYRFTILESGLIRIEWNEKGIFEDRATQTVINRDFPEVKFEVKETDERIEIITDKLVLFYYKGKPFDKHTLYAHFHGVRQAMHCFWRFGDCAKECNLRGTIRTLDHINGETELDDGIMNRTGFTELDDSKSLILAEDGWIEERKNAEIDTYLFAYFNDYYGALKAFYKLTGRTPLLPKYALGNMWSRNWKYTQDEYIAVMDKFEKEGYPFSVAVVDMDWHLTQCDEKYGTGWTGYTWNEELFPDYKKFLKDLHDRKLEVTLNLHPADGIRPFEKMYPEMAEAMGVTDGSTIEFDMCNPKFVESYFEILHNPYENDGVTFWWPDWQQGTFTKFDNLDPMWLINHFHTVDMTANGKRSMLLSRYAGFGSHRYPTGFSGDTYMTWESLDFQPYFNACASNSGYTWWSNDIGGYKEGIRDDELITRWVQLGVFSPINRLHSVDNPLMSKEPWNYGEFAERSMKKFLNLRHSLMPYLYTMNYRTYKYAEPLVTPVYYKHPNTEKVYEKEFRNEYYFGSEMLVSPITSHSDGITMMGSADMYIPDGIWFDFFTGMKYAGGKKLKMYRSLQDMPVLVKAGGIIPMSENNGNDISNPENVKIRVFAGADNTFEMYEDDGMSLEYQNGAYAVTKFELEHSSKPEFVINKPEGTLAVISENRNYDIEFNGYSVCTSFEVTENGCAKEFEVKLENGKIHIIINNVSETINIKFNDNVEILENNKMEMLMNLVLHSQGDNNARSGMYRLIKNRCSIEEMLIYFDEKNVDVNLRNAILEIMMA